MATHALGPIVPFDVELIREGTLTGIEVASQDFSAGALLINSSGSLVEASADPTAARGLAVRAASGVTGKVAEYWPIKAGRLYEASFQGTIAQSDINSNVGTVVGDNTNYWVLDPDETEDICQVVALARGCAIGDVNPRVLITFDAANVEGA